MSDLELPTGWGWALVFDHVAYEATARIPLMVEIRSARFDEVLTPHYSKQSQLRAERRVPYAGQHNLLHQLNLEAAATRRGGRTQAGATGILTSCRKVIAFHSCRFKLGEH